MVTRANRDVIYTLNLSPLVLTLFVGVIDDILAHKVEFISR